MNFEIKTHEISRELVAEGYTTKVDCKNYWNAHGKRIECAPTQYKFDKPKKFELYRVKREYLFEHSDTETFEFLFLYIDGEKLDVGEIVEFRELKTKVKLDVCIGAG